jgi:hypothetical protein
MKLIKRHLSVANVLSCLALFVALSGAAVAAKATLTKNQVKAKNIAKQAITTPKLKNGAVTNPKLGNGAVTGSKVADAAIRAAQLGGGVVTESKLKDHAVTGDKIANGAIYGPQLAPDSVGTGKILDNSITAKELSAELIAQIFRNLSYAKGTSESNTNATKSAFAGCPFGKNAIGGGGHIVGTNTGVAITSSGPNLGSSNDATGWSVAGQAIGSQTDPWAVEATVVCAELRVP